MVAQLFLLALSLVVATSPDGGVPADANPPASDVASDALAEPPVCLSDPCVVQMFMAGTIGDSMVDSFEERVREAKVAGAKAAVMLIWSPGGKFDSARRIREIIKGAPFPFYCFARGAASGAFWVLQACRERAAAPSSYLMSHAASMFIPQQEDGVSLSMSFLRSEIEHLEALTDEMAGTMAPRLRMRAAAVRAHWKDDQEWTMAGDEALENHVVDVLVPDAVEYYDLVVAQVARGSR